MINLLQKKACSFWRGVPLLVAAVFVVGCAGTPPYVYNYVPGRTARVTGDGQGTVPSRAPAAVARAIAAGNEIAGSAYVYGGGHGANGGGYDCSGATSYVLRATGHLRGVMTSGEFRHYGESGAGHWVSVYARDGHVFLVVAGLRFDTGRNGEGNSGPHWTTRSRPADGCFIRHPAGL